MQRIATAALALLLCTGAAAASRGDPEGLWLGAGVHYSQGTYGTGITTRITALAFTARYDRGPWTFRGTLPYLYISGSNDVVPGFGRVDDADAGESSTSGWGDLSLSAAYTAYYDASNRFGVDVSGKLKLGTADPDKRLGTGEHDLGVGAEVYKSYQRLTLFAGIGYTEFGTSARLEVSEAISYTLGANYRLDERDSLGVTYEERERLARGTPPQQELTLFFSRRMERGWRAQAYFLLGFADGSPDWGAGLSAAYPL